MRGILNAFGRKRRSAKPRYTNSEPIQFAADDASFGRAKVYGGFEVFNARLPDDVVAAAYGHDDLDFTWSDVCEFIDATENHRHLNAEQRAVAVVYFSCVGTDNFPVDILIDRKKIAHHEKAMGNG